MVRKKKGVVRKSYKIAIAVIKLRVDNRLHNRKRSYVGLKLSSDLLIVYMFVLMSNISSPSRMYLRVIKYSLQII